MPRGRRLKSKQSHSKVDRTELGSKLAGHKTARPVEQYEHKGKERVNNPPVGLVNASTDPGDRTKGYVYDPHLDPTLVWAGKAEKSYYRQA